MKRARCLADENETCLAIIKILIYHDSERACLLLLGARSALFFGRGFGRKS